MTKTLQDTFRALQQFNLDAIRVSQSTQLAALQSASSCVQMLAGGPSSMFLRSSAVNDMTELATSFTFKLLEAQVAYAKLVTDIFTAPITPTGPPPVTRIAPAAAAIALPAHAVEAGLADQPMAVENVAAELPVVEVPAELPAVEVPAELPVVEASAPIVAVIPSIKGDEAVKRPPVSSANAAAKSPPVPGNSKGRRSGKRKK